MAQLNFVILLILMVTNPVFAADKAKAAPAAAEGSKPPAAEDTGGGEKLDTKALKDKYWARGDTQQLGVVQNRTYSKTGKFSLGAFGGFIISDPFLSVNAIGGTLGYHFSEFISAELVGFKDMVSPSNALIVFHERGGEANFNEPKYFLGGEGIFSFIYGKVSLLGKSIIYYDMHLSAGLGMTSTESGKFFTPSLGIGQRYFISQQFSLRLDYRMYVYREKIVEKVITAKLGQDAGSRNNRTHSIMIGVDWLAF